MIPASGPSNFPIARVYQGRTLYAESYYVEWNGNEGTVYLDGLLASNRLLVAFVDEFARVWTEDKGYRFPVTIYAKDYAGFSGNAGDGPKSAIPLLLGSRLLLRVDPPKHPFWGAHWSGWVLVDPRYLAAYRGTVDFARGLIVEHRDAVEPTWPY